MYNRLFDSEIATATIGYNDLRIQLIAIDKNKTSLGDSIPIHLHNFYEFYLLTKGEQHTIIQGQEFISKENDFFFVPPNVEHGHSNQHQGVDEGILVRFSLSQMKDTHCVPIANSIMATLSKPHCRAFRDPELNKMLMDVPEDLLQHELYLFIIRWLLRLKYDIENDTSAAQSIVHEPVQEAELVKRVVVSITTDYTRDLNISALAEQHSISYRHLARIFLRNTGYTLSQFISYMRLRKGIRLLRMTQLPIREIAHRSGFHNEYYFSNTFSKHIGCSPSAFRAEHLGDDYNPAVIEFFEVQLRRLLGQKC